MVPCAASTRNLDTQRCSGIMAEQVKAADAPAPALSFGNFASKVESPSGGFNFKAPEFKARFQGTEVSQQGFKATRS